MAQVIADRRDIDFVLYEQMRAEELLTHPKYREFNKKAVEMIVSEARSFAIKEILPTYTEGDREGVHFRNGEVNIPECFRRPRNLLVEDEWTSMSEDPEWGGQGLPVMVAQAAAEYLVGANYSLSAYVFMGHGTGKMIDLYGTPKQKEMFLKKLYTGQWGGTMLLTESGAGSDVGALTTTAVKNPDGTYSLTGNKIFITSGEHDLTENIIHPVLARIEGAPEGTKGISLFIVPKFWVNEDGSIGERNDIVCTGVEEKMGIHGSATCSMALGSRGTCRGLLLGEENRGMKIMFHMMNEARLSTGFQGFIHASMAYLYALEYARERLQGKDLAEGKNPKAPQVPIIRHPDVRRMLLGMKAYTEGMRSFIYYISRLFDRAGCAENEEDRELNMDLIELLTPVVKTYCAEHGFDVCVQAIQVFGGAGYTRDYPVEQLARDCKITSIYEGTSGIQAMDLLGRKLGMKKGMVFMGFLGEIQKTIAEARKTPALEGLAEKMETAVKRLGEVAMHLGKTAMSPDFRTAFAYSHPFLDAMGDVVMAWMLLWRASVAAPARENGNKKDASFYEGQIKSAEYFIHAILPVTLGKMDAIHAAHAAAVEITEEAFGG